MISIESSNSPNDIADLQFEIWQMVPHKLSSEEAAGYFNQAKIHSLQESNLKMHCGQVYALIYG